MEDSLCRKVEKYRGSVMGVSVSTKIDPSTVLWRDRIKTCIIKFKLNIDFQ